MVRARRAAGCSSTGCSTPCAGPQPLAQHARAHLGLHGQRVLAHKVALRWLVSSSGALEQIVQQLHHVLWCGVQWCAVVCIGAVAQWCAVVQRCSGAACTHVMARGARGGRNMTRWGTWWAQQGRAGSCARMSSTPGTSPGRCRSLRGGQAAQPLSQQRPRVHNQMPPAPHSPSKQAAAVKRGRLQRATHCCTARPRAAALASRAHPVAAAQSAPRGPCPPSRPPRPRGAARWPRSRPAGHVGAWVRAWVGAHRWAREWALEAADAWARTPQRACMRTHLCLDGVQAPQVHCHGLWVGACARGTGAPVVHGPQRAGTRA